MSQPDLLESYAHASRALAEASEALEIVRRGTNTNVTSTLRTMLARAKQDLRDDIFRAAERADTTARRIRLLVDDLTPSAEKSDE
jgi:hypothetical protein